MWTCCERICLQLASKPRPPTGSSQKTYSDSCNVITTRRYPWGIQRLVSTRRGGFWSSQNSKCQYLPKFQFFLGGGGGYSGVVKTQNAKICLNSILFGGRGYSGVVKTQSAKICLNFNGGGYSGVVKTQNVKICLNFNFQGGGILE